MKTAFLTGRFALGLFTLLLTSCAALAPQQDCPGGTQDLPDCPPLDAIVDPLVEQIYEERTWTEAHELPFDPIKLGKEYDIPVQPSASKLIGPQPDDSLKSLAVKLWMIEQAEHSIDVMYYIFKRDLVGYAALAALCDAVKRGVDVRLMVDSTGSIHPTHTELKALYGCADRAGFIRTASGELSTRRARVQVVIFNPLSGVFTNLNRRSHDKLMVKDGSFEDKGMALTGGRNMSVSYYGLKADGSEDPSAYLDMEILLKNSEERSSDGYWVSEIAEGYYTLLWLFQGNKLLSPLNTPQASEVYTQELKTAYESLATIKSFPRMQAAMADMDDYLTLGFRPSPVRLAHEFGNLVNRNVTTEVFKNLDKNPNSIMAIFKEISREEATPDYAVIVSPYFFAAEYYDADGVLLSDEAQAIKDALEEFPNLRIDIITNSIITSDNFPAQSVIDMDTAPRMLLSEDLQAAWLAGIETAESSPDITETEAWRDQVGHSRLRIYETGGLDSTVLGGEKQYGKLHAKFVLRDDLGFVGTANFDYRSRLYNNEMGFFFQHEGLAADAYEEVEWLRQHSLRWGSPEWLEMRRQVIAEGGFRATNLKNQRRLYKFLTATGLHWLF